MTADEVLDAMARGIVAAGYNPATAHDIARAAIRALPPGWVVAKVPGNTIPLLGDYARGWDDALAAIRASAVEVE